MLRVRKKRKEEMLWQVYDTNKIKSGMDTIILNSDDKIHKASIKPSVKIPAERRK